MLDSLVRTVWVQELKLSRNRVAIHRERTLSNAAIALTERLQEATPGPKKPR